MTGLRETLRAELTTAMKARDRSAIATIRSALSAIANAEAVPIDHLPRAGAVEASAIGAGAADAPRRELSEADVRAVVEGEVAERRAAADGLVRSHHDRAAELQTEADRLQELLDRST